MTLDYATDYLTANEERDLAARVAEGDRDARNRLVETNLAFARMLAAKYADRGLDLDDLEQHARIGLLDAVDRFDPAKGRFKTIAGWHILKRVRRALRDESSTIRVPSCTRDALTRASRGDEQAQRSEYVQAASRALTCRPLGELADRDDERSALDWAAVPAREDARPAYDPDELAVIPNLLAALPARLADVIRQRFGLDGQPARTLLEIGRTLDLTRERVRQLETQALEMLRRATRVNHPAWSEAIAVEVEDEAPALTLVSGPDVEERSASLVEAAATAPISPTRPHRRACRVAPNQLWLAFGQPA